MASFSTLLTATKELCTIPSTNTTYDTFFKRVLNDGQSDFSGELNWKYLEARGSCSSSTWKFKYTLPADCDVIKAVIWEHDHYLEPVNHDTWVRLNLSQQTGTPRYYINIGGSLCITPQPDHSAQVGALAGAMTSGSNDSIVLSSSTGFLEKGRVIVGGENGEIIEYAQISGNNLSPIIRGLEGTGQIAHSAGVEVVQRNIEFDYFKVLSDMSADADVSGIPARYHRALPRYAASQFFYKTEDKVQGDNFMSQYMVIREQAKKDLSEKQAQKWSSALDDTENDSINNLDNTYPQDSSLS